MKSSMTTSTNPRNVGSLDKEDIFGRASKHVYAKGANWDPGKIQITMI